MRRYPYKGLLGAPPRSSGRGVAGLRCPRAPVDRGPHPQYAPARQTLPPMALSGKPASSSTRHPGHRDWQTDANVNPMLLLRQGRAKRGSSCRGTGLSAQGLRGGADRDRIRDGPRATSSAPSAMQRPRGGSRKATDSYCHRQFLLNGSAGGHEYTGNGSCDAT